MHLDERDGRVKLVDVDARRLADFISPRTAMDSIRTRACASFHHTRTRAPENQVPFSSLSHSPQIQLRILKLVVLFMLTPFTQSQHTTYTHSSILPSNGPERRRQRPHAPRP